MHVQFHQQNEFNTNPTDFLEIFGGKYSEINTLTSQGETKQYSSGIAIWIVKYLCTSAI